MKFNLFTKKSKSTKEDYYVVVYNSKKFTPVDAEDDPTDEELSDIILHSRILTKAPFSGCAGLFYDGDTVYVKLSTDKPVDLFSHLKHRFPLENIEKVDDKIYTVNKPEDVSLDPTMLKVLQYRDYYFIEGIS